MEAPIAYCAFPQVPESGYPDDYSPSMVHPMNTMAMEDQGEVLEHRTVHGFHWYRVRASSRPAISQVCALTRATWNPRAIDYSVLVSLSVFVLP